MSKDVASTNEDTAARRRWMGVLARAGSSEIAERLRDAPPLPRHTRLRGPEVGLVMVRGRQGGDGAPFNLGEMTVTRCAVGVANGARVGHAFVAGRDLEKAELAAVLDAALQDAALRPALLRAVIEPLAAAQAERAVRMARKAAATRVDFSTLTVMR
jgi:alpha-D-ribose 1-methylphosphonate 5-triphosphate synthase subunit PhnG